MLKHFIYLVEHKKVVFENFYDNLDKKVFLYFLILSLKVLLFNLRKGMVDLVGLLVNM